MAVEAEDALDHERERENAPEDQGEGSQQAAEQGGDTQTSPEIEALARELGWTPLDEFKGDPSRWRDPREYIKHGQDITRSLSDKVRDLSEQTRRMARTNGAILDRELKREREQLEQTFAKAVEDNDVETAHRTSQQLAKLPEQAEGPVEDSAVTDFKSRNDWYERDAAATAVAQSVAAQLHAQGKSPTEQVQAAEAEVKRRFPELFKGQTREPAKGAPTLNAPQSRTARMAPKQKGFAELPADARKAAEDLQKRRGVSLDEYARIYWQENEGA